jgi:hypothetical protein
MKTGRNRFEIKKLRLDGSTQALLTAELAPVRYNLHDETD